jgi:hypothetical protein
LLDAVEARRNRVRLGAVLHFMTRIPIYAVAVGLSAILLLLVSGCGGKY